MNFKPVHMIKLLIPLIVVFGMFLQSSSVLARGLVEEAEDPTEEPIVPPTDEETALEPAGDSEAEAVEQVTSVALVAPANGSSINNANTKFKWENDPNDPAPAFHWQLARDKKFSDIVDEKDDLVDPLTKASGLTDGRYYWRAQGKYAGGDYGKWSKVWYFIVDTTPPAPPILRKPADNSFTMKPMVTYTWKWVDKDSYLAHIWITDCSSVIYDQDVLGQKFTSGVTADFGTYCWYVEAMDRAENWSMSPSAIRTFYVTIMKGPMPDTTIKGDIPKFFWMAHPDAKGAPAPQYEIRVDDDPNFGSPEAASGVIGNVTKYTWPASLASGTWYWQIRYDPGNGSGWQEWMPAWSFVVP